MAFDIGPVSKGSRAIGPLSRAICPTSACIGPLAHGCTDWWPLHKVHALVKGHQRHRRRKKNNLKINLFEEIILRQRKRKWKLRNYQLRIQIKLRIHDLGLEWPLQLVYKAMKWAIRWDIGPKCWHYGLFNTIHGPEWWISGPKWWDLGANSMVQPKVVTLRWVVFSHQEIKDLKRF